MPPCSAMPFMIEPIACSRMPKCSVRPYGPPGNSLVCRSAGRNDGSPFDRGVVATRRGRPSRPTARAAPARARPAPRRTPCGWPSPFGSARSSGSVVGPAVGQRAGAASGRAAAGAPGWPPPRRRSAAATSACAAWPRSTTLRACSSTSAATSKVCVRVEARAPPWSPPTSSSPSAEPCALPVFCLFGAGQAMIVRSPMNDGRSVSALAASSAASSASRPRRTSVRASQSTRCTCQP